MAFPASVVGRIPDRDRTTAAVLLSLLVGLAATAPAGVAAAPAADAGPDASLASPPDGQTSSPNGTDPRPPGAPPASNGSGSPPNGSGATPARGLDPSDLPEGDRSAPLRDYRPGPRGLSAGDERVRVVVALDPDAPGDPGAYADRLRGVGASVGTVSDGWIAAEIRPGRVGEYRRLPWVERVRRPFGVAPAVVSEGVAVVGADEVQAAGITGEGAAVGVIDVEGFDVDDPEIADSVAASRSFRDGGIGAGGSHGTAVAEVVVDVAPDADLYVANFADFAGYREAADWLESQGVDVVVTSLAFFGQPNDGTGPAAEVASVVVADGTPWVSASGNFARDHWEGTYADGDEDGVHNFTGASELNYLNDGRSLEAGDPVGAWLTWSEWASTDENYDLYLYRIADNGSREVVASSTLVQDGDDRGYESITRQVPEPGRYALAVVDEDTSGPGSLELFVRSGGPLSIRRAKGSVIAPATGEGVTAVGAVDYRDRSLERFSSRGPANDGRRALNLVAPDRVSSGTYGTFAGTSAAAPHVAGVVALVASVDGDRSPGETATLLADTADDVGRPGADDATGAGLVNASAALARVSDRYPEAAATVALDAPSTLQAGASGSITTSLSLDGAADRATLTASFDPHFAEASVTDTTVEGRGSVANVLAGPRGLEVVATDLSDGSRVVVELSVTAPGENATHVVATGATVEGRATSGPTAEVTVEAPPPSDSDPEPDPDPGTGDSPEFTATVERTGPGSLRPGTPGNVTTTVTVGAPTDRLVLNESFDPALGGATVTNASVAGNGSVANASAGPAGVTVAATDLSNGSVLSVTYRATVGDDPSPSLRIAATLEGGNRTLDGPATTVPVVVQSPSRSLSRTTAPAGGELTVRTTVDVEGPSPRAAISERFDPATPARIEDVVVEGNGSVLFTPPTAEGELALALEALDASSTVEVVYTLTVPENLSEGDLLRITGDATLSGTERSLGTSTVVVGAGARVYANESGVVGTTGLRDAIGDWAQGRIGTDLLQRVIRAWATGEPVG